MRAALCLHERLSPVIVDGADLGVWASSPTPVMFAQSVYVNIADQQICTDGARSQRSVQTRSRAVQATPLHFSFHPRHPSDSRSNIGMFT